MRRPMKPFSVEVKRGRNGAASAAPHFFSKLERQPAPVEKRPATPAPEPAKPQRRILEAIVAEPAPAPAAAEEPAVARTSLFAESIKPRRGRPPKEARDQTSAPERPKLVASNKSAAVYTYARREIVVVAEPPAAAYVAAPPRKKKPAVVGFAAQNGRAIQNGLLGAQNKNGAAEEFSTHGHVNHAERVEEATSLPRGERWKRRLPKVLW